MDDHLLVVMYLTSNSKREIELDEKFLVAEIVRNIGS